MSVCVTAADVARGGGVAAAAMLDPNTRVGDLSDGEVQTLFFRRMRQRRQTTAAYPSRVCDLLTQVAHEAAVVDMRVRAFLHTRGIESPR